MKESRYNSRDESIGLLFWQVSTLWQRAVKSVLRQFDLTHTQYVILAVIVELSESDIEITQKKISDFSMIDPMTVSSTLRLLEKKGLTQESFCRKTGMTKIMFCVSRSTVPHHLKGTLLTMKILHSTGLHH